MKRIKRLYSLREMVPMGLLVVLILVLLLFMPKFAPGNLPSVLKQASFVGIAAVGALFVFIVGEVDLSIGAQYAFYGLLFAYLTKVGLPVLPAALFTLLVAGTLGALIGYCISRIKVKALLATLAISLIFQGLSYMVGSGLPIFNIPKGLSALVNFQIFGVSTPVFLLVIAGALGALVLHGTYYGKYMYAVGENNYAAEKSGISVRHSKMMAFSLCSVFTATAAIAYLGYISYASESAGYRLELDVLTAVALAGVSLEGGRGKVLPVLIATLFLGGLSWTVLMFNAPLSNQYITKGAILLCAILTNRAKA